MGIISSGGPGKYVLKDRPCNSLLVQGIRILVYLLRKPRLREVNEIARQRWVLFDAKLSALHTTPHLPYNQMVQGGNAVPGPPLSQTGAPTNTAALSVLVLEMGL